MSDDLPDGGDFVEADIGIPPAPVHAFPFQMRDGGIMYRQWSPPTARFRDADDPSDEIIEARAQTLFRAGAERYRGIARYPERYRGPGGIILSPGEEITDPDRADQLGLTVSARWLRCHGRPGPGPDGCACRPQLPAWDELCDCPDAEHDPTGEGHPRGAVGCSVDRDA